MPILATIFFLHLFSKLGILNFYSNGKLLITGEYLVLDGASALALPTEYGQDLKIKSYTNNKSILNWSSLDLDKKEWFSCKLKLPTLQLITSSDDKIAFVLRNALLEARKINKNFLQVTNEVQITTALNFDKKWGLGTSSTLINNIASWAKVNAFKLQLNTFGGSAYDIACAQNNTPILYQLKQQVPIIKKVAFNPIFKEHLFFVYLNTKQNSRDGIQSYRNNKIDKKTIISEINTISKNILHNNSLKEFEYLLKKHEEIISKVIGMAPVQQRLFSDYYGQIKSLGAWGGDFILATGDNNTPQYFKDKGYQTVLPYAKMIL